ncbi:hypothetical protein PENSTE_c002G04357 [Penicillium steckii]|uniref:Beta-lactamase-related domain-containing protein n=1 Tax=Penicillium steckii TaxID=303698 RepID=A0A1V6TTL6_9EURO|nr:hypothetical protein PENSTE_c002G04357 [Penicillium steckii]
MQIAIKTDESPFDAEFDALVSKLQEEWKVLGLSIAVVHGSNSYSKAYGLSSLPDKEMTTDTLFPTCSTTKGFTALSTALVIQDSQTTDSPIDWNTPLSTLLPEDFVLADDYATTHTTLEDALSHRSGLPDHGWTFTFTPNDMTSQSLVRSLRHLPLTNPPRTTYHYSNHMFSTVSYALEQQTGQSLGSLMKERIWDPLGMHDTYFSIPEVKADPSNAKRLSGGYTWMPDGKGGYYYHLEKSMNWMPNKGAGAMVSTVQDYSLWLRALIEKSGPLDGQDSLIKPRNFHFETGDVNLPSPYHAYALGWYVDNYRSQNFYWHTGGWPGFGSYIGFLPEKEFGFVFMGNSNLARRASRELAVYLMDKLLGPADPMHREKMSSCFAQQREELDENLQAKKAKDSKRKVFPNLPDPPIPHSLPLEKYTGTYRHPANAWITLEITGGTLTADVSQGTLPSKLTFTHASGDFFVAETKVLDLISLGPYGVEFYVDSTGTATKIGMPLEPVMKGENIWFERSSS